MCENNFTMILMTQGHKLLLVKHLILIFLAPEISVSSITTIKGSILTTKRTATITIKWKTFQTKIRNHLYLVTNGKKRRTEVKSIYNRWNLRESGCWRKYHHWINQPVLQGWREYSDQLATPDLAGNKNRVSHVEWNIILGTLHNSNQTTIQNTFWYVIYQV